MAKNGSTIVDVTAYHRLEFLWSTAYQNTGLYTSQVGWSLYLHAGDCAINNVAPGKAWKVIVDGKEYSGTNDVKIAANSSLLLASGTKTIQHDTDGTGDFTYSFSQEFSCSVKTPVGTATLGTFTGDGSGTLCVIGLTASTLSTDETDPILGKTITLKVVSNNGNNVRHTVKWSCGSSSGNLGAYSSGATFTFTPGVNLAFKSTKRNHVPITFTITTYNAINGNALVGTSTLLVEFYIPAEIKPSCEVEISDPTGIFDKYGYFVKSLSKFQIDITGYPNYGSPIASYYCRANGGRYYKQSNITDYLFAAGNQDITYSVEDARGRSSGEKSVSINVVDYNAPKITKLEAIRCDENGTENRYGNYIKAIFSASVTSFDGKNTATYSLSYKKKTETTYTQKALGEYAGRLSVTNGTCIFAADIDVGYNIVLFVADSHNESSQYIEYTTGFTLLHFGNDGTSVSVGKLSEESHLFDIGIPTRFNEPIYGSVLGLGYMPPIPESATLSTYLTPGGWSVPTDELAETISDLPVPVAGRFEVASENGTNVQAVGEAHIRQKYIPCDTKYPTFERRISRSSSNVLSVLDWNAVSVCQQKKLWSGSNVMGDSDSVTLEESIGMQPNGIVLVFKRVWEEENGTQKSAIRFCFMPKFLSDYVTNTGSMHYFLLSKSHEKYLTIYSNAIYGHAENEIDPNDEFKLIHVIGV